MKIRRVYEDLADLFANVGSRIQPIWADIDLLKIYLLIILPILLVAASITFAFVQSAHDSLPLFVGLLGSIIGYLIGERRSERRLSK
jgi:hypothetical protein